LWKPGAMHKVLKHACKTQFDIPVISVYIVLQH
jgi:hypothetical protein